jgi:hypothetical protein
LNNFKDIKINQDPKTKVSNHIPGEDSREDANLITKILLSSHGLNTDRFKKLSYDQMLYCEDLLCTVVQNLCNHLTVLSEARMNSLVYITHLENCKK